LALHGAASSFPSYSVSYFTSPHYLLDISFTNMHASGFANAPVTRVLVIATVVISFLATLTDTKYYAWIDIRPHLFDYHQFWRLFTWQLCYTNSTEVLFATMTLYNLRVIERLWSSRKFAVCPDHKPPHSDSPARRYR